MNREQFFMYECGQLRIPQSDPRFIPFHLHNYLVALTYAMDLPERDSYLDYGCGSGYGTEIVGALFRDSTGIDTDNTAIEYARIMHARSATVYWAGELEPERMPEGLGFVTMIEVIEHMPVEKARKELRRIANYMYPQGAIFITTPSAKTLDGSNPNNPHHIHEYQPGELKEILSEVFEKVDVRALGKIVAFAQGVKGKRTDG